MWVLADKFLVKGLKEEAITAINKTLEDIHNNSKILNENGFLGQTKEFFSLGYGTEIESEIKDVVVKSVVDQAPSNLRNWSPELPRKMLEDLVCALNQE